jgi:hypothetical protein
MRFLSITAIVACSFGSAARAEPMLFPVQGGVSADFLSSSRVRTRTAQFTLAYVRAVSRPVYGWRMFAGAGPSVGSLYYWESQFKSEPRVSWRDGLSVGLELRFGIICTDPDLVDRRVTGAFGLPRFVVKAKPMWAPGVDAMGLPGEHGLGIRASAAFAWPMWSLDLLGLYGVPAVILPTEIEYVFQHVPNVNEHGMSVGWSF